MEKIIFNTIKIEYKKREKLSKNQSYKLKISALGLSLAIMGIIFLALGVNPLNAMWQIFSWALLNPRGIAALLTRMIPLLLMGIGLAFAFKAVFWNIGAEGQLLIGAIIAVGVGLFIPAIPDFLLLPSIFLLSFLGAALYGLIPVFLKLNFKANEVIITLMLNFIASSLVNFLIQGPWQGENVSNFPLTDLIPQVAREPLIPGTTIYLISFILSFLIAIGSFYFLNRTTIGYEIKVIGENINAAEYAGMNHKKTLIITMIISAGLAGLAGAGLITGLQYRLQSPDAISPGYGFTAIIVAWLGGLNPFFIILSAIFMSILIVGGQQIQIALGLPFGVVNIFNGVILAVLIAFEFIKKYEISLSLYRAKNEIQNSNMSG